MVTRISARRDRTRQLLLGELGRRGALTRTQLAAATGLSPSATAAGVADLLADGLMSEDDATRNAAVPRRGRRSTQLTLARPSGHVIGIDFGHMHVRVAVADTTAAVLAEAERSLDVDQRASAAIAAAADIIHELLGKASVDRGQVLCVAAGVPGPLDRDRKVVSSPTILRSWIDLPAADELSRRLGLPVIIDNDADMGALGEKRYGAGRDYDDFLYIDASHGIGAGIVINGHTYRGARGLAGEIGHTQLPGALNRCRCGNQGCLESVISVPEVRRQLAHTHLGSVDGTAQPPLTEVAADPVGARVLADAGRIIGRVVADGCNWINPEAIILGGELGASGPPFAEGFRESVDRYAQPATAAAVAVHTAALGPRSVLMGAIAAALDRAARY